MFTSLTLLCAAEDGNDGDAKVGADVLEGNGTAGETSSQQKDFCYEPIEMRF